MRDTLLGSGRWDEEARAATGLPIAEWFEQARGAALAALALKGPCA